MKQEVLKLQTVQSKSLNLLQAIIAITLQFYVNGYNLRKLFSEGLENGSISHYGPAEKLFLVKNWPSLTTPSPLLCGVFHIFFHPETFF